MGQEDFTTWTESDPNNRLSQTAPRSTWNGLVRTDSHTYLYKNKSGDLQNFTYYFKLRVTDIDASSSTIRIMFSVVETLDDWQGNRGGSKAQFGLQLRSNLSTTVYHYYVAETWGGIQYVSTQGGTKNKNTDYYIKIVKSGTSFTVYWYSDAAFSNLIESKSITLHANHNLPYMMMPQSIDLGTAVGTSGYIENLTDVLLTDGSADFNAEFEVRHAGSEDLPAVFETSSSGSADLKGFFIARHTASADLKGLFEVDHTADLEAEVIIRNVATKDLHAECFVTVASNIGLHAEFQVGQGSLNLYAKFESQGIGDLYAEFESQVTKNLYARFTAQATKNLYAKFNTQATKNLKGLLTVRNQGYSALKCSAVIRHSAIRDLKIEFIPMDFGTEALKVITIIRQTASLNLLAYIRCLHCRGLKAEFTVRHSSFVRRRVYARFKVIQTPVPIELAAEFTVTRKGTGDLKAIFATSTVNGSSEFKTRFYVRPKYLLADSSRIDGRIRKTRVRGGTIVPVIAKTASTRIRGEGRS